jgi:hypothetical protein
MAEDIPTSTGGPLPPRRAEAAKVQPKKETVRINLPPKPTSAPTIKLPTLAPGSPPPSSGAAAPVAVAAVAAAPAPSSRAPAPPAPPPAGAAPARVAPATSAKSAPAPSAAPRPIMAPVVTGLTPLDKGLAIGAVVASLVALIATVYLAYILKDPSAM